MTQEIEPVRGAVILSAGRGRRLLPLTETLPKCLLPVGGRSVIEWQLGALGTCNIPRATVVVGFGAEKVREVVAAHRPLPQVRTLFNPRFDTADNLISCWMARGAMRGDFLLLNGDTLFEPEVPRRLLASEPWPVTVAVVRKRVYDEDDMKVHCEGASLRQIGKGLAPHQTDGESIGMLLFRGEGPRLFREALERAAASPLAPTQWYLSVINDMAGEGLVRTLSVDGLEWTEIDYLRDLEKAEHLVAGWQVESQPALATTA
jgi:choline kinase